MKRNANGNGSVRKISVARDGKTYTYWQALSLIHISFLVSFIIYWQAAKWQEYDMWHFQHIFPVAGFYDILK